MVFLSSSVKSCSLLLLSCLVSIMGIGFAEADGEPSRDAIDEHSDSESISYFLQVRHEYPRDCVEVREQCQRYLDQCGGVFLIKPDSSLEPFEVLCVNDYDAPDSGWMVIQRRSTGSVTFNRSWKEYVQGFGFLSNEFWLGNEKLSYITNQAVYELRIDVMLANGSSFYITYNSFRISDEWGQFKLTSLGTYSGNASFITVLTECPPNMVKVNCTWQRTCDDPNGSKNRLDVDCVEGKSCVCADGLFKKDDECVLPSQCGCFQAEYDAVIPENMIYVNAVCSEKCTCLNNQLICQPYGCSLAATCKVNGSEGICLCNDGYHGDGETCRPHHDCYDVYLAGQTQSGVYNILPEGWPESPFEVYCDMSTSGGGWTVFQRRVDGTTDFYRNWTSYRNGFGSLANDKDFWLGNEKIFYLTNNNRRNYTLRVDIVTFEGIYKYATYTLFQIGDERTRYQIIDIGDYSGTAGDGIQFQKGSLFSTYDEDNDRCSEHNCAERHMGAWWYDPSAFEYYNPCDSCHEANFCDQFDFKTDCSTVCAKSNLNGKYSNDNGINIFWSFSDSCKLTSVEMKLRPT
ncbi:Fibrinogen C domain-containing protein 1 [Holothuria leucospilota]|uniref:Fibrinogen C domain-containing protein 1 n=1 Tax=Holothuria leucospilota TaxID=206669 RepID=A0A9Q0YMP5_HOLLE|nr:Fibrinogen C domain-containing protein 1 [Holothuria leucospilota]